MTVVQAKKEYNKQLERYYKAIDYFESEAKDKDKFFKDFQQLLLALSSLLKKIGVYSQEEVLGGFK